MPGSSAPSSSGEAQTICRRAADRYIRCMEELLGEEAGALAKKKQGEGVPACAADPNTVAMYRACLPKRGCAEFRACLDAHAKATDPRRPME